MKTLFEEDLMDAGYELPSSGLCYNLDPDDAKALISEGEWLLAEDELVAREGQEQRFLYMIVSGSVELSKKDEKGKSYHWFRDGLITLNILSLIRIQGSKHSRIKWF